MYLQLGNPYPLRPSLLQVSAHMMILAELQSTWRNRETSLAGKQVWLTGKVDEMDNKISVRVRTAFKRMVWVNICLDSFMLL